MSQPSSPRSRPTPGPTSRSYALIEAPSILGLKPTGVERLPATLLRWGLADRLQARHAARLATPEYNPERDPATGGTLNAKAIAEWSPTLADAVEQVLDAREFPVVLGGDCSIVLGSTLALKRRGRYGLLFIDGHADFYQPEANPNGEAASMDLAFATGHGPKLLTDLEGRGPLVRDEDAVVFGFRDAEEQKEYGSQPLPPDILAFDLATVRKLGAERAACDAVTHLTRDALDGFFIHVDADCLSDDIMPAVDYRLPDGLTANELTRTLQIALASGKAVGLEITIYNPSLDADGVGRPPAGGHSLCRAGRLSRFPNRLPKVKGGATVVRRLHRRGIPEGVRAERKIASYASFRKNECACRFAQWIWAAVMPHSPCIPLSLKRDSAFLQSASDRLAAEIGSQQAEELVHVLAQDGLFGEARPGRLSGKQVGGVQRNQVLVALGVERDIRDDADAESKLDIGLDQLGVPAREHDLRCDACFREDVLHGALGRREDVRDEWIRAQHRETRLLRRRQRMRYRNDQAPGAMRAGQNRESIEQVTRTASHHDVHAVQSRQLRDLLRRVGMQRQSNAGKSLAESVDHLGQHVTSFRVSAAHAHLASLRVVQLRRHILDVLGFA